MSSVYRPPPINPPFQPQHERPVPDANPPKYIAPFQPNAFQIGDYGTGSGIPYAGTSLLKRRRRMLEILG
jgi:hypothetical protein